MKTLSQRKDLFGEWQGGVQAEERTKRKAARKAAKAAFITMLVECEQLDTRSSFAKASRARDTEGVGTEGGRRALKGRVCAHLSPFARH